MLKFSNDACFWYYLFYLKTVLNLTSFQQFLNSIFLSAGVLLKIVYLPKKIIQFLSNLNLGSFYRNLIRFKTKRGQ